MSHSTSPERSADEGLGTVTPPYFGRPDAEMDVVGWLVFLALLAVLFPLLPFFLVALLLGKAIDFIRQQTR